MAFVDLLMSQPKWLVLTGAGVSAASGVPTYRNPQGEWQRKPPVTHQEFVASVSSRQRFWARNIVGWRFMASAQPNSAHRTLLQLEHRGVIAGLITQNVDGLHQRAGSTATVDLHGRIDRVSCLSCGVSQSRASLQPWFATYNAEFVALTGQIAPDGDADIDDLDYRQLVIPDCARCGGVLKPDAVFFGDSIPAARVRAVEEMMAQAPALLVIGSSLQTYSGYRFCLWAKQQQKPIALLTKGVTRADHLATVKAPDDCIPLLHQWLARMGRDLK